MNRSEERVTVRYPNLALGFGFDQINKLSFVQHKPSKTDGLNLEFIGSYAIQLPLLYNETIIFCTNISVEYLLIK